MSAVWGELQMTDTRSPGGFRQKVALRRWLKLNRKYGFVENIKPNDQLKVLKDFVAELEKCIRSSTDEQYAVDSLVEYLDAHPELAYLAPALYHDARSVKASRRPKNRMRSLLEIAQHKYDALAKSIERSLELIDARHQQIIYIPKASPVASGNTEQTARPTQHPAYPEPDRFLTSIAFDHTAFNKRLAALAQDSALKELHTIAVKLINLYEFLNTSPAMLDEYFDDIEFYVYGPIESPAYWRQMGLSEDTFAFLKQLYELQVLAHHKLLSLGVSVICPVKEVDAFNGDLHETGGESDLVWVAAGDARHDKIHSVRRMGFRHNDRICRKASVRRYVARR
jgi:hypothetical protein